MLEVADPRVFLKMQGHAWLRGATFFETAKQLISCFLKTAPSSDIVSYNLVKMN